MYKKLFTTLLMAFCATSLSVPANAEAGGAAKTPPIMSGTQDLTPPRQIGMMLDGFHCIKKELGLPAEKQQQIHAMHYCAPHGDMFMCAVYDGAGADARLVAIEYVVNNDTYQKFSAEEKKMWHPHDGEVDTGLLRMPGFGEKEKATLTFLKTTWGKTWQLWPDLKNNLPVGQPVLLWAIDPKKISKETLAAKEKRDAAMKESAMNNAPCCDKDKEASTEPCCGMVKEASAK